jgi:hypothetical protein
MNTIVANPQARFEPRLARATGTAGGWILGIAWTVLVGGLLVAGLLGWAGWNSDADVASLVMAALVAAGTLLQFLLLFSYAVLLRGMAQLLRRVG